jgi:hypothetical protein
MMNVICSWSMQMPRSMASLGTPQVASTMTLVSQLDAACLQCKFLPASQPQHKQPMMTGLVTYGLPGWHCDGITLTYSLQRRSAVRLRRRLTG